MRCTGFIVPANVLKRAVSRSRSAFEAAAMADTDTLKFERVGGLASFGLPGSALKSQGEVAWSALSVEDRRAGEGLFSQRAEKSAPTGADGFRYRITQTSPSSPLMIEVQEDAVPKSIGAHVRNVLE